MLFAEMPAPNSFTAVGWLILTLAATAVAVNQILKLTDRFRGKTPQPPNEKLESDQSALEHRVGKVEGDISEIWTTMRSEDAITRNLLSTAVGDFERAIGRLEGTLKQVDDTMRELLKNALKH